MTRRLAAWTVLLCLGCALPPGEARAQQRPATPDDAGGEETAVSIRFGDPPELAYEAPFFPGTDYDPEVPTPDDIIGDQLGRRLWHHDEILACFETWAAAPASRPRLEVDHYGVTHEGRELLYAVITSERNHGRLDEILANRARLADPRGLSDGEAERLMAETPPVAWLGYSIHGDELSGADAAVAFGYHLLAGTSDDVTRLLDELVIVLDVCMNPDGRERIISQIEQGAGYVTNLDYDSMHRGRWPWGRGNHYLFDMNRDWIAGTQPETRGRWATALRFHPQLFVDAHEMESLDTYLFYPQARPHNPFLPPTLDRWQTVFAADLGASFDRQGWSYYTREWADGWGPFYSDAWGSLNGAVGILYEQSSTAGSPLRRASGQVFTYREAVHHQATASLANVTTLADHAAEIQRDCLAYKRASISEDGPGQDRTFVLRPGPNASRDQALLALLLAQGIEVLRTTEAVTLEDATGVFGVQEELDVPAGALLVPVRQPQGPLVRSYLDFDVRMDEAALLEEREELERNGRSKIYDTTAWSLAHAFDLDAWWAEGVDTAEAEPVTSAPAAPVGVVVAAPDGGEPVAWAVDGADDASVRFAVAALEAGLAVHFADEPFTAAGHGFSRGSLLVRAHENDADAAERVAAAARASGVVVRATSTSRSPDAGPDLGGQHFHLLARPRIAVLGNMPIAPAAFGHVWHLLDRELAAPMAMLDAQTLAAADLRRYNAIVVPSGFDPGRALEPHKAALRDWVRAGGTLVAFGSAAGALAREDMDLTSVRRRRDELDALEGWRRDARREVRAREVVVDTADLWGEGGEPDDEGPQGDPAGAPAEEDTGTGAPAEADQDGAAGEPAGTSGDEALEGEDARRLDAWRRRFSPAGVYVRGLVDQESWITAGCRGDEMPVMVSGSLALLSRAPVRAAVRLADGPGLRLSGLLWPEARTRMAGTPYLTVERVGRGQVILFAGPPAYRGTARGTARLLSNAVVYGPGVGASQPVGW